MVALPWLVYRGTSSSFDTAMVFALYTLPYVLFGALAGVAIDRLNKRAVMIGADLVRACLVLAIPWAAQTSLALVFGLAFALSTATVIFDPCKLALLPEVTRPDQLLRANSVMSSVENIIEIVGYGIAGFVLAYVPIATAFRIDAASFLVSACALALVRYRPVGAASQAMRRQSLWRDLREGVAYLRKSVGLRANTIMVIAATAGIGASYPLTFFLAVSVFGGGARTFGVFEAVIALGYLIGSLAAAALSNRVRLGHAMTIGISTMGVSLTLVAAAPAVWLACLGFALLGLANAMALISTDTFIQSATPAGLRGRVFGVRFMLTQGMYALSVLAGGFLTSGIDVRILFIAAGIVVVAPGVWGLFVREIREAR